MPKNWREEVEKADSELDSALEALERAQKRYDDAIGMWRAVMSEYKASFAQPPSIEPS